jgi:hypothetical protein
MNNSSEKEIVAQKGRRFREDIAVTDVEHGDATVVDSFTVSSHNHFARLRRINIIYYTNENLVTLTRLHF